MEIFIRPYNISDKNDCVIAFKSNLPLYFTEQEITDFENFLDKIVRDDSNKNIIKTHYYVILLHNQIIGCGGFGDKNNTEIISLAWGLIHFDFHKKGFGKALLKHRLKEIQRLYQGKTLVLDTTQHSYHFFEKFGFKITEITEHSYAPNLHRFDMIFENNEIV
jgi:N-acetylglutamate synthase-like GNAT family acetyltransferase